MSERDEIRRNRFWLVGLWVAFYCTWTLLRPALLDDADSVHAEVAREMLLRHDWVTLYANGIRYLEKAPLYYWAMAASMKLFGVSAWASRVPLALAVGGLTWASEALARRMYGVRAGLYAGLITLTSFGVFIFSRINLPDVVVCLWLVLAMFCYLLAEAQTRPSRWLCWGFAAACALDVLTKGLIGVVFPVGIVLVHLLVTRRGLGRVKDFQLWSSAGVFALIAVPWHVLVGLANPSQGNPAGVAFRGGHFSVPLPADGAVHGWTWFYFVNEQVLRYLNLRVPRDYDTVPLWLFLGLIVVWLMPWSGFLPGALWRGNAGVLPLRRAQGQDDGEKRNGGGKDVEGEGRANAGVLRSAQDDGEERKDDGEGQATARQRQWLLLIWAVLPLVFFSLSTRQEYYVLPSLPPLIFLIAGYLAAGGIGVRRAAGVLAAVGAGAGLVCVYLLLHTRAPAADTDLASLLQQNPGEYALSFGHFLDLNGRALGLFRGPLGLTAVAFGVGLPLAWWAGRRRQQAGVLLTAAAAFVFLIAAHWGLVIFSPTLTSARLARVIAPQVRPGDMVAIHGEYEAGSTLGFYLRRNDLHIVEGRSSNLWYGSFFTDAPRIFETRESMAAKWAGPQRIFLWEDPHDAERPVLQLPGPVYVVAEGGGKRVLSNRPFSDGR